MIPNDDKLLFRKRYKSLYVVFCDMENSDPQIMLHVSKDYSATQLPGYLTVINIIIYMKNLLNFI